MWLPHGLLIVLLQYQGGSPTQPMLITISINFQALGHLLVTSLSTPMYWPKPLTKFWSTPYEGAQPHVLDLYAIGKNWNPD